MARNFEKKSFQFRAVFGFSANEAADMTWRFTKAFLAKFILV